jgi:aminopeptidase
MRSVPAETSEAATLTSACPARGVGTGTSSMVVFPFFRFCRSCFIFDFTPTFYKIAYDQFESRIRIHSATNTRATSSLDPAKSQRRAKAISTITASQMRRGGEGVFKWVTTLFPTDGYAQDAGMSLKDYEDFVFNAVHAHEDDPIAYWKGTAAGQQKAIDFLAGKDVVTLRGPNVDLTLSIKGRKFMNSTGTYNMPDGEIYTGPVEDSVNGWVRFTYPAIYGGVAVEGAELTFNRGRVEQAKAEKNEDYLIKMLESDDGSRYLGEFAIGTNFDIDRFTGNILFDEKIGGHLPHGARRGLPRNGLAQQIRDPLGHDLRPAHRFGDPRGR